MTSSSAQTASDSGAIIEPDASPLQAITLEQNAEISCPVVFASPHSGRVYPAAFLELCTAPLIAMRQVEDAYIDKLFAGVSCYGSVLLSARRARCYIDVNRDAHDYEASLFKPALSEIPSPANAKAAFGLGCLPRIAQAGCPLYHSTIPASEYQTRLQSSWYPYHHTLVRLLTQAKTQFGSAILIDCHSMPSASARPAPHNETLADIVLGDRYGRACASSITDFWEDGLHKASFKVARNTPYAGGYCTTHYGQPDQHQHALQIEIRRDLYLDETRVTLNAGFPALRNTLCNIARNFTQWAKQNTTLLQETC